MAAIDVASNIEDSKMRDEIIGYLNHRVGLVEFLQYKTPLKKVGKSWKLPVAFLSFNFLIYIILFLFIFPTWETKYEIMVCCSLFVGSIVFWLVTVCKNAGDIKPHKEVDFLVSISFFDN